MGLSLNRAAFESSAFNYFSGISIVLFFIAAL
jgi:hypothetical protein